jgi:outer membrane protein TolC
MTPIDEILRPFANPRALERGQQGHFVRRDVIKRRGPRFSPLLPVFLFALGLLAPLRVRAEELAPLPVPSLVAASVAAPPDTDSAPPMFPKVRAITLEQARAIAMKRSPALAISSAKIAAAQADEREVSRRFKINTAGGLDPFAGKIRFYLALDLERLAGLNKAERQSAKEKVEQQKLGAITSQQDTMKRVSAAWYALASAQMGVESAARRQSAARALHVAADARFRAGQGELSGVLSSMNGSFGAEDAYQTARQNVAVACLELAQSCGYLTAETMESDL